MNIVHVFVKFQDQFSFAYSTKIVTVSQDTFNKMLKGVGDQFSHFDKANQIRQDMKVIEVRQALQTDYSHINGKPKRYKVETDSKGTLYFDELPAGTYFCEGSRDASDKGKATYFTFDTGGSSLIPIIDTTTGKQVLDVSRAGREIK